MGEHKHGEMDVTAQERAFAGFVKGAVWVTMFSIAALLFLAVFNT